MHTELTDGTITLRQYRESDIEALYAAARESITEIYPWLAWCHPKYSREESVAWIRSRPEAWTKETEYTFVITDSVSGKFLGSCGIHDINRLHLVGSIGYWIRTSATKKNIATRATILASQFGFKELGLHRMEILTAVGNIASQRVAEKAGATREGVLRGRLKLHDGFSDTVLYSLIFK